MIVELENMALILQITLKTTVMSMVKKSVVIALCLYCGDRSNRKNFVKDLDWGQKYLKL